MAGEEEAGLSAEALAAIALSLLIAGVLLLMFFPSIKAAAIRWASPQTAEGNAISLSLCDYRYGRAEHPFEWSSKQPGLLSDVAKGLADCEWLRKTKVNAVNVQQGATIKSCMAIPTPTPVSSCSAAGGECRIWDPISGRCYDDENNAGAAGCSFGERCCIAPTSITAYLAWDDKLPVADQYLFSRATTYKIIAERLGDANLPDVCMCVTTDLQRHNCW